MEEITVITCSNDKIKYDAFLETLNAQDIILRNSFLLARLH